MNYKDCKIVYYSHLETSFLNSQSRFTYILYINFLNVKQTEHKSLTDSYVNYNLYIDTSIQFLRDTTRIIIKCIELILVDTKSNSQFVIICLIKMAKNLYELENII